MIPCTVATLASRVGPVSYLVQVLIESWTHVCFEPWPYTFSLVETNHSQYYEQYLVSRRTKHRPQENHRNTIPTMTKRSFREVLVANPIPIREASPRNGQSNTTSSSPFRDAVDVEIQSTSDKQLGENGCLEYTNSGLGSDILAISQMVRGGDPISLTKTILGRGATDEVVQLVELIFVTRNTRGGKGEKKLSYDMFLEFFKEYPETAQKLLRLFPHYGYWKDLLLLMELGSQMSTGYDDLVTASLDLMREQWLLDLAALKTYKQQVEEATDDPVKLQSLRKKGPKISLLAKWLPRERSALDKKIRFVDRFIKLIYPLNDTTSSQSDGRAEDMDLDKDEDEGRWKSQGKAMYRKQVSDLTSFLGLPEVLLASRREDEIAFERVASKATKLLTKVFLNENEEGQARSNDPKRVKLRDLFLDHIVKKGLKGGQVMPHEIVATILKNGHISRGMELSLDAQWKSLWKTVVDQVQAKAREEGVDFNPTQMVPICDVSGSMSGTPMEVCIALGIGISEITHDAFKNMVLTFSESPKWHRLNPGDTIVQKVRQLQRAPWGMNTDFCKAYDLMLQVCVDHKLERVDMPSLIVFSDMQFDEASRTSNYGYRKHESRRRKTMFETIQKKVASVASQLNWGDSHPTPIVFWNLRNTGGHPVDKDTDGAVLLAGFSPSLLKLVMNGEALKEEEVQVVQADGTVVVEKVRVTPEEVLKKMLEDTLYDPVREILGESTEGALREYECLVSCVETDNEQGEVGVDVEEFELI